MSKRAFRLSQAVLLLLTMLVITISFYLQFAMDMVPCPLCIMQRSTMIAIGAFLLMGLCLSTLKRARMVVLTQLLFALFGFYFACRQLWLQSLSPNDAPACLPQWEILWRYFPWKDVLHALFWGAADCAETHWQWLGFSLPAWAAFYFVILVISGLFLYWQLCHTSPRRS